MKCKRCDSEGVLGKMIGNGINQKWIGWECLSFEERNESVAIGYY